MKIEEEIWNFLSAFRGNVQPAQIAPAVLREIAHQLGESPDTPGISYDWQAITQQVTYPHLQAVARAFLQANRSDRLELLDELLVRMSMSGRGVDWIDCAAARQIADLVGDAASVRCAFTWSLHPALQLSLDEGRAVRFIALDREACELARLAALFLEAKIDVVNDDPFERTDGGTFDAELSMPPFGDKLEGKREISKRTLNLLGIGDRAPRLGSEAVAIADALTHTSGRVVMSLSAGVLFRTVGIESVAREELVKSGRLRAILSAPGQMIYPGTGIATGLLVLETPDESLDVIRFLDLSNERFSTRGRRGRPELIASASWRRAIEAPLAEEEGAITDVPRDAIALQNNILTVDRYLMAGPGQAIDAFLAKGKDARLEDLVEIIRPSAVQKSEDGEFTVFEASPGDIGVRGYLEAPSRQTRLDQIGMRQAQNQRLVPGDVMISTKATVGVVGIVPETAPHDLFGDVWIAGQSFMILRPKTRQVSSIALFEYLSNDVVREHLRSLSGGAVIQGINIKDLRALRIPIPTKELQAEIEAAFRARQAQFDRIEKIQASIAESRAQSWPHRDLTGVTTK